MNIQKLLVGETNVVIPPNYLAQITGIKKIRQNRNGRISAIGNDGMIKASSTRKDIPDICEVDFLELVNRLV